MILDLSFPEGSSVNDGISKEFYCGQPIKLTYPTIDDMARHVFELGPSCLLYKIDLSRFFRQIPLCPLDWSLMGMRWGGLLYFDKFFPMGLRSAAYCCQRVTNAIAYIHHSQGYWSINSLDDFGSAELQSTAWSSFFALRNLLEELRIDEAIEKCCPPSPRMEFLGNWVDADKMTIEVTENRLLELHAEIDRWLTNDFCTRTQLESLIGKLSFVTNCVRAGRVFISRLINSLTGFPKKGKHKYDRQIRLDLLWWKQFLRSFNGVSILWLHDT